MKTTNAKNPLAALNTFLAQLVAGAESWLVRVETSQGDRVQSRALGCWLRAVSEKAEPRLRLATGARGETLVPTVAERADALARQVEDAEARAESAEAEVARLRMLLAKTDGG